MLKFQLSPFTVQADSTIQNHAIIIIGGDWQDQSNFNEGFDLAYEALLNCGYTDNDIRHLDVIQERCDRTRDGEANEYNIQQAFTNWLYYRSDSNDVCVVFIFAHGCSDSDCFALSHSENQSEHIYYNDVNSWLANVKYGRLIVVVDACHSGRCINDLSDEDRIIITSAGDEITMIGAFSHFFWPIAADENLMKSFNSAALETYTWSFQMGGINQIARLDDNGDDLGTYAYNNPLPRNHDGWLSNATYFNATSLVKLAVNTRGEDANGNHTLTGVDVCINDEIHRSSKVKIILAKDCLYTIEAEVNVSQGEWDKWTFDRWEDGPEQNPREDFPLTSDESITAIYKRAGQTYNLTIGESSNGTTNPTAGIYEYNAGTPVQVEATPNPDCVFDYWTLDGTKEEDNPINVTMDSNHTLEPIFSWPNLTIQTTSGGSTDPVPGTYEHPIGASVPVKAKPNPKYNFDYWVLDEEPVDDNPINVTMSSDHDLMAHFTSWPTLTIQTTSGGSTNRTSDQFDFGTLVPVEAIPNTGYVFNYWKLDGSYKTQNPITVTMDSDHTLKAYFSLPGCPYVYTWNGSAFIVDSNVLGDSEVSGGADVEDFYKLEQELVPTYHGSWFSWYSLQIREFENEHSYLDKVRLYAIDHDPNVEVAVTQDGQILTYSDPNTPVSAIDNFGNDWLSSLLEIDDSYYRGFPSNYLVLDFGGLDVSQAAKLVLRANIEFKKELCIHVQTLDQNGDWTEVSILRTRNNWSTIIVNLENYLPNPDGTLKVRLYFNGIHRIDYVGLDTTPQAVVTERVAIAVRATHSIQGPVTFELLFDDGEYGELLPNEQITLGFILPNTEKARTFILYIDGHYETIE